MLQASPPMNYHEGEKTWLQLGSSNWLSSGIVQRLGLGIQSLALCRLSTNSLEALDAKLFAGALHSLGPEAEALGIPFLGCCRRCLGDHFASFVLGELVLGQATRGLGLGSPEDGRLGSLALGNVALLHRLHGFHRLHDLHWESHGLKVKATG